MKGIYTAENSNAIASKLKETHLYNSFTRKMVPITGRARSFLLVFKNKIERRGRQNKTTCLSIYPML